jgi:hypothetical protein
MKPVRWLFRFASSWWLATGLLLFAAGSAVLAGDPKGVRVTDLQGKVRITIDGELFTEYYYKDVPRPYFYPIIGPGGAPMTRNWPMKEVEGEERDHKHHRSLWWAHGDLNGHDFWSEGPKAGTIVHEKFTGFKSGPDYGQFRSKNKFVAADGTLVATSDQVVRVHNRKADRMLDFEITIHASEGELTFGDTKEGTMAIRIAESMRLIKDKKPGAGHIVNSDGVKDGEAWGKRARWCDYYGPVNGQTVGVAIIDHPQNPRFPTWWHVRDYGLFAANPFGVHDFEKKEAGAGKLVVPDGQSVTFKYRFYFHRGNEKEGDVAGQYADWVTPPPAQ